MNRYSRSDWQRLGDAVGYARRADGFTDTQQWCEIVGRSDRMLLGLERGEPVGKGTLRLIEDALDWPAGQTTRILAGQPISPPEPPAPASVREATDDQLIEELRRRLVERQVASDGASIATEPHVSVSQDENGIVLDVSKRTQRVRK